MSDWNRLWEATRAEDIAFIFSLIGFVLWLTRTGAYRRRVLPFVQGLKPDYSKLTVVVPVRDEESNVVSCLNSINEATRGQAELIVVDDHSTDGTAKMIEALALKNLKLIRTEAGVEGGKNQACAKGAANSTREWILFTDADTRHRQRGTDLLVAQAQGQGWDLTSALPFHLNPSLWEKLTASFHACVFVPTAPYQEPTADRLFAIGQYLLFKRKSYLDIGGHEAVGRILAEDVELATRVLNANLNYQVWSGTNPYAVRMYDGFLPFVAGWRRNLRLGLARGSFRTALEMICVYSLFINPFLYVNPQGSFDVWLSSLAAVAVLWLAVVAREWGNFGSAAHTVLGFVVGPPLFAFLSLLAAVDRLMGKDIVWRNRAHRESQT